VVFALVLTEAIAVDFVDVQVLALQSTERHDSEHRGPAFVAYGPVSWRRLAMCLRWSEQRDCC
jgi:hypothetical protein